jgi:hypothetical protein
LQTYFYNDPRIHEWIDQITEKIFTVCLLKGLDAEKEFNKGCKIVGKLAILLRSISIIPEEYLEDVVKQLFEQQLPDIKIIDNFTTFEDIKKRMLREGIDRATNPEIEENTHTTCKAESDVETADASLEQTPDQIKLQVDEDTSLSLELIPDQTVLGLNINSLDLLKQDTIPPQEKITTAEIIDDVSFGPSPGHPELIAEDYNDVPEEKERLERVLLTIYPGKIIAWGIKIEDQQVFAKIEDLLICLDGADTSSNVTKLNRQGWKVFVCSYEDLMFPRRIERGIRQTIRKNKQKD